MNALQLGEHHFDLERPLSLARDIAFEQERSLAFGLPAPSRSVLASVNEGQSVNCDTLTLCVHGAGTHTESARHVYGTGPAAFEAAPLSPILAQVFHLTPIRRGETHDTYAGDSHVDDSIIIKSSLNVAEGVQAVVVKTQRELPDTFTHTNPPYFSDDALVHLRACGVQHLLTDLPSVDRENDGGSVSAHKSFFGDVQNARGTITELCDLSQTQEGLYALSLFVPPLHSDAAPSRPILYPRLTRHP